MSTSIYKLYYVLLYIYSRIGTFLPITINLSSLLFTEPKLHLPLCLNSSASLRNDPLPPWQQILMYHCSYEYKECVHESNEHVEVLSLGFNLLLLILHTAETTSSHSGRMLTLQIQNSNLILIYYIPMITTFFHDSSFEDKLLEKHLERASN